MSAVERAHVVDLIIRCAPALVCALLLPHVSVIYPGVDTCDCMFARQVYSEMGAFCSHSRAVVRMVLKTNRLEACYTTRRCPIVCVCVCVSVCVVCRRTAPAQLCLGAVVQECVQEFDCGVGEGLLQFIHQGCVGDI